jgi:hypothetical protein
MRSRQHARLRSLQRTERRYRMTNDPTGLRIDDLPGMETEWLE